MARSKRSKPELQTVMSGLAFPESPRWHDDHLWFSDWGAQQVIAVDLKGNSQIITNVRSFPFCIAFLPDGHLLIVAGQRLLRMEPDGSVVTHADLAGLAKHDWNDIVVDGRGNAYVNTANFDFPGGAFAPGIIALVTPDGAARTVADGVAFPNGMAVTPDNTTLIVAESFGKRLTAFDIAPDGGLSKGRVWAELGDDGPDGICLDAEKAIWCASGKRCLRVREGGEVMQTIDLELHCFACALGGPNKRTLFRWSTSGVGMRPWQTLRRWAKLSKRVYHPSGQGHQRVRCWPLRYPCQALVGLESRGSKQIQQATHGRSTIRASPTEPNPSDD